MDFAADALRATDGRGVDLILGPVGGDTLRRGLGAPAAFGRPVSFGNASGDEPWRLGQADLTGSGRSVAAFSVLALAQSAPGTLRLITARARNRVSDGTVKPPVTAEFPLAEAAAAPGALRLITARARNRVSDGTVKPPATAEFPLAEAAAAHTLMGGRTSTGKLLPRIADQARGESPGTSPTGQPFSSSRSTTWCPERGSSGCGDQPWRA